MIMEIDEIRKKIKNIRPGVLIKETGLSRMTLHNLLNKNYKGSFNMATLETISKYLKKD